MASSADEVAAGVDQRVAPPPRGTATPSPGDDPLDRESGVDLACAEHETN